MKKDTEVKLYMQERRKGTTQRIAAARAGISERTARKYEHEGKLPPCKPRPCLPWCVNNTLSAIAPHKYEPYNATSPGGKRCMDPSRR